LKELAEAQGFGDLMTKNHTQDGKTTKKGQLPFGSMDEALQQGVGMLNSDGVVAKVQQLVGDSGSVLGSLEVS
jgi:hypothetical protein